MLKRQRILLHLLKRADKPLTRIELTKWCFLLRHEMPSQGGPSFFDFVPYQYGPFSFSMYQELDKLAAQSFIETPDDKSVVLTPLGESEASSPSGVAQDVEVLVTRFRGMSTNRLLDYVYDRFPEFTVNSVREKRAQRPTAVPNVYTAGYEKCSVDQFLSVLVSSGIRRLIDVRMNPVARRYGFHKSTLQRLCGKLSIDYRHLPELGIHSSQRQHLATREDYDTLFLEYQQTTLKEEQAAISRVVELVAELPSVLVCMEADPCFCHRLRLASVVADRTGLKIVNLRAA